MQNNIYKNITPNLFQNFHSKLIDFYQNYTVKLNIKNKIKLCMSCNFVLNCFNMLKCDMYMYA